MVLHSTAAMSDSCSTKLVSLKVQTLTLKKRSVLAESPTLLLTCFTFSLQPLSLPATKIVFNRLNGKKYHHAAPALPADNQQEESFTPAHEENIKFVYEAWQEVVQQEQELSQRPEEAQGPVHYKESTPSPHMNSEYSNSSSSQLSSHYSILLKATLLLGV
uniref:MAPK regulated corepressor interacting protein 2-like n=1 Tax=Mastacembelus armatus TaxID=205130 RepID=A0A7N8Y1V2_9TELE